MNKAYLDISLDKSNTECDIYLKQKINFSDEVTLFTLARKDNRYVNSKTQMFKEGDSYDNKIM